MPRFRKTSRLTKKGGINSNNSGNPLNILATLATNPANTVTNQANAVTNQEEEGYDSPDEHQTINPEKTSGSTTPKNNKINSATGAATLGNIFNNVRSPAQTNLNSKLNEPPNNDTARSHGGGYKKSRKNSRIKSKRKKGGKSAKKRRRRTRGKKR